VDISLRESLSNKRTTVANRKRRADTPGPEVEVTKMFSREVKAETVNLSDSDDEIEIEIEERDTGINADDKIEIEKEGNDDGNDDGNGISNRDDALLLIPFHNVDVNVLEVNHSNIPNPPPLTLYGQVSDNSPQQGNN